MTGKIFSRSTGAAVFVVAVMIVNMILGAGVSGASAGWKMPMKSQPTGGSSVDLDEAKSNYGLYCASCHGERGDGKGQLAETLDPPPADHTDAARMSKSSDDKIFKTISEGGSAVGLSEGMPPHNTILGKEQIRGLVKYIRELCKCEHKG